MYLRGFGEQHNMKYEGNKATLTKGDVVIIQGEGKNRGL